MRTKSYVINQIPIPWARARLNGTRFFDGQKNEKLIFGITLQSQHENDPMYTKPLAINMTFYLPLPQIVRHPEKFKYHKSRPDLDNLCKFLLDSLTGVLIEDDRLIYAITMNKQYDNDPRTEFTITEV